jgi:tRNA(Ile)-lysidine synthase
VHLAHTLDDQAETVMLRLAAGSTWRGLAGMAERAPLPRWPEGRGLTLVRPLLTQRRAEMRATLRATGAAWIEDPANALTRYARVRARATMEDAERWAALAARCAVLAAALDADARTCIADAARLEGEIATVSLPRLMAFPHGVQLRALSALVTAVAGASREPPEAGVARLLRSGGTLGGAWARHDGDTLKLRRDPGPLLGRGERPGLAPIALKLGKEVIWDGRLAVTAREPGWSIAVDPRGLVLRQDAHQLTLIEAKDRGLAQAEWLIGERIAHLLWR